MVGGDGGVVRDERRAVPGQRGSTDAISIHGNAALQVGSRWTSGVLRTVCVIISRKKGWAVVLVNRLQSSKGPGLATATGLHAGSPRRLPTLSLHRSPFHFRVLLNPRPPASSQPPQARLARSLPVPHPFACLSLLVPSWGINRIVTPWSRPATPPAVSLSAPSSDLPADRGVTHMNTADSSS